MSQEKIHEVLNYILVSTGAATAGISLNFQLIDETLSLIVKCISVLSFLCFLLINQDKIQQGWSRFKSRFKKK